MKLKKIASLALAGVMAVSMLAGCSNGSDANGEGTVVNPGTSSIVTAINNGQDEDNDVKVTFSSDSVLDAALQQAIKTLGVSANSTTVEQEIVKLTGNGGTLSTAGVATVTSVFPAASADKQVDTILDVQTYVSSTYWTEADAEKAAARDVDAFIANLKANDKEGKKNGDTYYDFTYTGNASLVAAEKADGSATYYVAYTITRTTAKNKVEV